MKLVLLDRTKTVKEAKELHELSTSDFTHFKRLLPLVKRRLVQLLGDKELHKGLVKDIGLRRGNGMIVTFDQLWRKHGGDMVGHCI